ncbi:MAG: DUF1501 domain-containing protein [Planctomycetes bacterium]|nr:DUF1501 domain-containing protein [Planctomycetota bacterium]
MEIQRRTFLRHAAGCLATGSLYPTLLAAAQTGDAQVLAPTRTHHPAKARRLVFVFLTGGFSHVDTFDYKPRLLRDHGRIVPSVDLRGTGQLPLLGSPFRFRQHGQAGQWVSEIFPNLARAADDLCIIRSLHTDIIEHFQAVLAMHTGSSTVPMPSIGSWLSYGLGTQNPNLPAFVVLAEHLPYAGTQNWDSHFLPPVHQGVRVVPGPDPIANLRTPARSLSLHDLELEMLRDVNTRHADARPDDANLGARMNTFEVARGMMREAPEALDLSQETDATLHMYGLPRGDQRSFAYQCLLARRLIERGVRVVELIDTGAADNWDAHGDMQQHRGKAARVDRPLAALIRDMKRTGLLEDTLIAICTEFGRTPWSDGGNGRGRNHFTRAFTCLLAGAGVKPGVAYGETDEHGLAIVRDPCHVHDYHATILHLMGIDHTRLTYRFAGRDFRLTDVHGRVVREILA